ncbi:hypothetical protein Tsp_06321 [Trichinella spiralis]|nr:hypothetical protein Tsp_06321 [Trichinella spiralis]
MSRPQQHSLALVRNEQKFSLGNQLTEDQRLRESSEIQS